ncbi:hypothetical protein SBA6_1080010 [Candidatus Sulfopaludibacter sp. SbA6]|nr:hypothetical protein SBA6_1080010 [Candidatus Sulfopaludibacter sp. SbA6]
MKPEAAMTDARQLLSDELMHQIEETAHAQNRKPSEVLEEAVRKYLDEQSWQTFVGKAEERNRAKGLTEDDVPRLVSEVRRENERGRYRC